MDFRVLGSLTVVDGEREVTLGPTREGVLLAVLLVHADDTVTSSRLIDELWDGSPPAAAPSTLVGYVHRLRRVLPPGALLTRGTGYALCVGSEGSDARRFERLADDGRRLLVGGDATAAAEALGEALDLWRGPAFAEFATEPFARAEAVRLEERRVLAIEDSVEARLRLGRHDEVAAELEALVGEHPFREPLWGQLMLALYRAGRQADALRAYARLRANLGEELGIEPGAALRDLEEAIVLQKPELDWRPPSRGMRASDPPAPVRDVCPYKGLAAFELGDTGFFFGRERLVSTLVSRLAAARFVGVVGASGSGKSSLVRAGLLGALAAGALPGSECWPAVVCTPGADSRARLAHVLAPLVDVPPRLETGPGEFARCVRAAVRGRPGARLVVVVDQFEENMTLCRDREVRDAFVDALVAGVSDPDIPLVLAIALRADSYGTLAEHPDLARLFEASQVLVGAMTDAELRRAVTEPARRAGLVVEDGLADAVCADAAGQPGALPLVSTALLETWVRRDHNTLTVAGYLDAGGVQRALAVSAEDVYTGLDTSGQRAMRRLFLQLVDVGEGTAEVHRRVPLSEVGSADTAALHGLVQRRLVTAGDGFVEVAHEALLSEWPRLRSWLEEDREGRRVHRRLTEATAVWEADGRDAAGLYRGGRLDAALEWSAAHPGDANPVEHEFLDASSAAQDAELRSARRTGRRLRALAACLAVVLTLTLVAASLALVQRSRANHQAASARRSATAANAARLASDAARLAAQARNLPESQLDLALLLAVQSRHVQPSPTTDGAIEAVLARAQGGVDHLVNIGANAATCSNISADGRLIAAGGNDGNTRIIDSASGRVLRTVPGAGACASPFFNADGSHLVVGGTGGKVTLWDVSTGQQVGVPITGGNDITGEETMPGRVVTASRDGTVLIWDTSDPDHPRPVTAPFAAGNPTAGTDVTTGPLWALADRANPNRIGIWEANGFTVFDLQSHAPLYPPLRGYPVGESNDGRTIVLLTGSAIRLWDVATGHPRGAPLGVLPNGYFRVWTSPDGTRLAVTDYASAAVRIFEVTGNKEIDMIPVGANGGMLRWLNDGRLAIAIGDNIALERVGPNGPAPFATPMAAPGPQLALLAGPAGRSRVVTEAADGTLSQWDASDGSSRGAPLAGINARGFASGEGLSMAVSADGRVIALPRASGTVELWDTAAQSERAVIDSGLDHPGVVLDQSGRMLAVTGENGTLELWDITDTPHVSQVAVSTVKSVHALSMFSPNGRFVLFAGGSSADGRSPPVIELFTVPDLRLVHTLNAPPGWPTLMAFSPDSSVLATPVMDPALFTGQVIFWDVATGVRRATLALPYAPDSVAFVNGGTWFATSELASLASMVDPSRAVSRVDLWDSSTLQPVGEPLRVRGDAGVLFANRPGGDLLVSGSYSPVGRSMVWDLDPPHWEATACRIAGRNLTQAEWNQYLPGRPYRATCPQWAAGG